MATHGKLVHWKDIRDMLDACAPGWRYEDKKHRRWVYYGKVKEAFKLPLGQHGRRRNPEIQPGHVRGLARHFDILDCAKELLGL